MAAGVIRVVLALVALLLIGAAPAGLGPPPTRRVTDEAAVTTAAVRDDLEARLATYERGGGHQVLVWIGRTGGGRPIDELAVEAFAAWKVGRAGLDDGVALFILVDDHAVRIEVGYGLEDRVTDLVASQIIRDVIAPRIVAGDFDGAVSRGVEAIVESIEGRPDALGAATSERGPPQPEPIGWATWIMIGIAAVGFLVLFVTHPRLALMLLWTIVGNRDGNRRGGGLGGFIGGGGRSGGGGATGGW